MLFVVSTVIVPRAPFIMNRYHYLIIIACSALFVTSVVAEVFKLPFLIMLPPVLVELLILFVGITGARTLSKRDASLPSPPETARRRLILVGAAALGTVSMAVIVYFRYKTLSSPALIAAVVAPFVVGVVIAYSVLGQCDRSETNEESRR